MSGKLQRFDRSYLRDFRGPITARAVAEDIIVDEVMLAPPAPSFTQEQMEAAQFAARKAGFTEGFEAGSMQARKDADMLAHAANTAIAQLSETLVNAHAQYQALLMQESAELSQLVMQIAKKVAAEALDARSHETVMALVARCLPVIFSKPRLMVDVHPEALERVIMPIETMLRTQSYEGDVQFRSNPSLGTHDIALDWGSGQANRSVVSIWAEIESLIQRVPLELTFAETLTISDSIDKTTLPTT